MRSKVGNEGREIVADILDCVTPILFATSFCVSPFAANNSFIYTFIRFYLYFDDAKIHTYI
nr:MAG TPA: hypothetical protein [Caudoviricetes sp.]